MLVRRCLATAALIGLMASPVLAQPVPATGTAKPAVTAPAAPAATPAAPAAKPATTTAHPAAATAPSPANKVNLNTATAAELDALPHIGKARSKVILDERAKGKFKDWADFDKRTTGTSVNAGVKNGISQLVTF